MPESVAALGVLAGVRLGVLVGVSPGVTELSLLLLKRMEGVWPECAWPMSLLGVLWGVRAERAGVNPLRSMDLDTLLERKVRLTLPGV